MNDTTQQQYQQNAAVQTIDGQEYEVINGVACPIDPQERLQCEGCQ